ncbi:MAG: VTC domain-containing protein [Planctomycetes bacterium]|nr:VTC domain-containing protein [Planctomycetota bacterium]
MTKRSSETDALQTRDGRYELKMACRGEALPEIKAALSLDPAGFRTLYPPRRVQSIYLDTPEGDALDENLAGISHREKIRFRWYGDRVSLVQGRLECKIRENLLGWKRTLPIRNLVEVEGVDRWKFVRVLHEAAGPDWQTRLSRATEPVQWISYRREYFGSADGKLRVTVDDRLEGFDQRGRIRLSARFKTPVPHLVVVEVKCASHHYDPARRLINRLPFFVDKCSKFVTTTLPDAAPTLSYLSLAGLSGDAGTKDMP